MILPDDTIGDPGSLFKKRPVAGHTSVACQACRKRKSKCTGGPPPCRQCQLLNRECIIDQSLDNRRRPALQKARDESTAQRESLSLLIETVVDGDPTLLASIAKSLRTEKDPQRIALIIQHHAQAVQIQAAQARENDLLDPDPPPLDLATGPESSHAHGTWKRKTSPDFAPPASNALPTFTACHTSSRESSQSFTLTSVALQALSTARQFGNVDLPCFAHDSYISDISESDDIFSKTVLSFRDTARQAIHSGASSSLIVGPSRPNLELFFRPRQPTDSHTAWTWACEFAKAFEYFPFPFRLATVYIMAIQMRYFIDPCKGTFDDLPPNLRPIREQDITPHVAALEICHLPPMKHYLFLNGSDDYETLLASTQSVNWPYSDAACLAYDSAQQAPTFSRAFLEHVAELNDYSVGADVAEIVPAMKGFVRY